MWHNGDNVIMMSNLDVIIMLWLRSVFASESSLYVTVWHINGLMQKRRNSNALAMELRLFWIDPLT